MLDRDGDLRHPERADVVRAVPVELHVGHRADRPESVLRRPPLDAVREPKVGRLGAVQLAVQRETERDPALGHDVADRPMQAETGEEAGDTMMDYSELPLEHAAKPANLVVLSLAEDF